MSWLFRALKGKERLPVVFWGYCVAGTLLVGVLLFWASRLFPPHGQIGGIITGVIFIPYFLWAHISLWMCAFNAERRGWSYVARCYALVVVIFYFVGVAANFGWGQARSVSAESFSRPHRLRANGNS
jgi:hypothetical protein